MVDWALVRERYRAYRRSLSNTWTLFKESKFGILAVLAPVLPLRDPIFWRAPSDDVIDLPTFWAADTSTVFFGAGDPIESQIAYRVPGRFTDPPVAPIYVGLG